MKKLKSFTLIELLIVIVIIGVLATFVVWSLGSAVKKSKDARTKDSVRGVQTQLTVIAGDRQDLRTYLEIGGGFTNVTQNLLKDPLTGEELLQSSPLDASGNPVMVEVDNNGNFAIRGSSAVNSSKCWYATNKSNNLSESTASTSCSAVTLGL